MSTAMSTGPEGAGLDTGRVPFGSVAMESVACDACGGEDLRAVLRGRERRQRNVPQDVWGGVVRCARCDLQFLSPRVREADIGRFYPPDEYYTHQAAGKEGRLRRIRRETHRQVAVARRGYPRAVVTSDPVAPARLMRVLSTLGYASSRRPFRRIPPYVPDGRLLELGFGAGGYISLMQEMGWACSGVEMDREAVERMRARGIHAVTDLWDTALTPASYDVVTSYHAFEHVYEPTRTLERMVELLKPGGSFFIGVPNASGLAARTFGTFWDNLGIPLHPYQYSPETLRAYLERAGLRVTRFRTHSLPQSFLGSLQYVLNAAASRVRGADVHALGLRDSRVASVAMLPFTRAVDWLRMGDAMEFEAVKVA